MRKDTCIPLRTMFLLGVFVVMLIDWVSRGKKSVLVRDKREERGKGKRSRNKSESINMLIGNRNK